jgi:hypothetical protein
VRKEALMSGSVRFLVTGKGLYGGMVLLAALGGLLWTAGAVRAETIRVPADLPTIQAGIDAAGNGDMVLVADGTYSGSGNVNLNTHGKAITVASENGPLRCVIDGQGSGGGFIFNSGEDGNTLIDGFTFLNCAQSGGGAISCADSSPTIVNCIMRNCRATLGYAYGGAIKLTNSSPRIINCLIVGNTADGAYFGLGGGIYNRDSSPELINCTISDNYAPEGGAMLVQGGTPTLTNCIIWGNDADEIHLDDGAVVISYSDVLGGWDGTGNINENPAFVDGVESTHYLSHVAAGQSAESPCIDAGSAAASQLCFPTSKGQMCLSVLTTRTDHVADLGPADMGFHHPDAQVATPTPGPDYTPVPYDITVELQMPATWFSKGDPCWLKSVIHNEEASMSNVPFFVVLDVMGTYYFWNDWTTDLDFERIYVPAGDSSMTIIPEFTWPDSGQTTMDGLAFWGALTDDAMTQVLGELGYFAFGFGP